MRSNLWVIDVTQVSLEAKTLIKMRNKTDFNVILLYCISIHLRGESLDETHKKVKHLYCDAIIN